MNPARNRVSDYRPAKVTLAVLTSIPHHVGYFSGRFDVLKLCLASLVKHTEEPHDLLVFDNDSCGEVKDFLRDLQEQGVIRFLVSSSENVGKLGALQLIAQVAPGEIIAYCDDDTFFYPGWLPAHIELMEWFPNVAELDPDIDLVYGQNIPEQWEIDYAISLGRDLQPHLDLIRQLEDIIIERDGVRAFAAAGHSQFVIRKEILQKFLPGQWTGRMMGGMMDFDNAVADAGYLRLSTYERTTRNIGGLITEDIADEAKRLSLPIDEKSWENTNLRRAPITTRFLRWSPIRWFLQGLYNRLFWLLSNQSGEWFDEEKPLEDQAE
jgi:glycosyltransferase involved in cell wall biosynthesis